MTLEIVEGLAAAPAAPQRLAGGRTKFGKYLGILRAALRTGDALYAEQCAPGARRTWRSNAVFAQLAAAILAHPVGGPGGRQHGVNFRIPKTFAFQRKLDFERDHVHRRTSRIGRRNRDLDVAV